jgi:flavin-dependent dehydrogenase
MIVGSGPAGISTWLYLNKYHPELASNTLIIEKETHPRKKLCGGALQNSFIDKFLNDMHITLTIPQVKINSINVKFGKNGFSFNQNEFISIIERSLFDHFLVKMARKRGANILENVSFLKFTNDEKLKIKTSNGNFVVKILVGADGALSKVRKNIASPLKISYAKTLEVYSPVNPKVDSEFDEQSITMDWSCFKEDIQGYVWHFPCIINGKPYLNHGIYDCRIHRSFKSNLTTVFHRELKKRNISIPQSIWKSHPIPFYTDNKLLYDTNILLVGDAAGIEPLIGGGIHLSLLYGDIAAQTIISAYENRDFSFHEYIDRFNNHVVGKFINNSVIMAKKVYAGKLDLLETIENNLENMSNFGLKNGS